MGVIFLILKILGIIFISFLIILIIVMILPMEYKLNVDYDNKLDLKINIKYGYGLFCFDYDIQKESVQIKIFGKTLESWIKLFSIFSFRRKNKGKNSKAIDKRDFDNEQVFTTNSNKSRKREVGTSFEKSRYSKSESIKSGYFGSKNERKSKKVTGFFENFESQKEKIKDLIAVSKDLVIKLIKSIGIKTLYINSQFGLDDPSITGKLLGFIYSIAYLIPILELDLKPNFDSEIFIISTRLDGKLRLGKVGYPAIKAIFKVYKIIKKS